MITNFKVIVEYDGSHFAGWQIQKNGITVQEELQKAISMILNKPVKLTGSGRTDAGVHALGQVANFHADTSISPENLLKGVNSIIKLPIVLRSCDIVEPHFHARYDAISKEYHYYILNSETPCSVGKDYIWHIRKPLDMEIMNQCCGILIGEHDFKSFEASGSPRAHTIRNIYSAGIEYADYIEKSGTFLSSAMTPAFPVPVRSIRRKVVFRIVGNGFLRFMVRNIVGTLVMAGLSRITHDKFRYILEAKDRTLAGATAPARGLFLMGVNY